MCVNGREEVKSESMDNPPSLLRTLLSLLQEDFPGWAKIGASASPWLPQSLLP